MLRGEQARAVDEGDPLVIHRQGRLDRTVHPLHAVLDSRRERGDDLGDKHDGVGEASVQERDDALHPTADAVGIGVEKGVVGADVHDHDLRPGGCEPDVGLAEQLPARPPSVSFVVGIDDRRVTVPQASDHVDPDPGALQGPLELVPIARSGGDLRSSVTFGDRVAEGHKANRCRPCSYGERNRGRRGSGVRDGGIRPGSGQGRDDDREAGYPVRSDDSGGRPCEARRMKETRRKIDGGRLSRRRCARRSQQDLPCDRAAPGTRAEGTETTWSPHVGEVDADGTATAVATTGAAQARARARADRLVSSDICNAGSLFKGDADGGGSSFPPP
ncbi:hypothetical protein ABE10_31515 [Bacillus toyonensis]|nr:hypothetical protein [Bacillus toyonensis]